MTVLFGMRNFLARVRSSLMNQPPMFTSLVFGLKSSTSSIRGGSLWLKSSFTRMAGTETVGGSLSPGEPPSCALGRQLALRFQVYHGACSFTMTSEAPGPSVIGYHLLS